MFYFRYPCGCTVRTLLQCGADVNVTDAIQNTPLHVFLSSSHRVNESILKILCDANPHLDYANVLGETPIDITSDPNIKQLLKKRMKLSLKCLCARLIQKNNISFHGKVSNSLVTFVEKH
jgi:ankyrin repeat protein